METESDLKRASRETLLLTPYVQESRIAKFLYPFPTQR